MMMVFILAVPISCLFSVKFALSFQPVIDAASIKNISSLKNAAIWCGTFAMLDCIFMLVVRFAKENLLRESYISLKGELFSNIINMDIDNFNKENGGNYISMLDNDVKLLSSTYFSNFLSIYIVIMSFIFSFIAVFYLNYIITIILLCVGFCSVMIPKLFEKKLAELQQKYSMSMQKYISWIKDFLDGFEVIKSFNIQKYVINSHEKYNSSTEYIGCSSRKFIYFVGWISTVFSSSMYVVTFVVGGYFAIVGKMTVGLVVSLSQLIGGVVAPLEQLPSILAEFHSSKKIVEKLQNIIEMDSINDEGIFPENEVSEISLKDVSFSYTGSKIKALKDVNIKLERGKKYAIVGESGSGKTTIAKMILRFYKPDYGNIKLNDYEIEELSSEYLYHSVSYMHQNTFLFDDIIKNNITLYHDYADAEIMTALKLSGLSDFLNKLPEGINTKIGENGIMCSGGERQRLGIARALICRTKFLILD